MLDGLDATRWLGHAGRSWPGCGRGWRSAAAGRGEVVTRRLSLRRSAAGALCLASVAYAGAAVLATTPAGVAAAVRPRAAVLCAVARAVPESIPVAVHRVGRGTVFVAGVCIDGRGPFPFIVDSGSVQSVVATALARRLRLASTGPALQAEGISCRETVHPARIGPWSLGPIALAPQQVLTAVLPHLSGIRIDGLLGSDVLSRFGAVRLDAARHALFVAGPERGFAAAARVRLPSALGRGRVTRAPLVVVRRGGRVIALTDVAFGSDNSRFVVDTGAVVSVVSAATAAAAGLSAAPGHLELAAVGCTARLGEVHSGRWRLSGTTLRPERLGRLRPRGIAVAGLLGSDVLLAHGAVVLDYAGHALVLARG